MWIHATFLYATLALCALGIAAAMRRYDVFPREPWYSILGAVLVGALLMWIAGRCQVWAVMRIFDRTGEYPSNAVFAALAAGTEELGKLLAVGFVAVCFRKVFEETSDGVVYGGFAGLGAAILESVYNVGVPMEFQVLPLEEPVRLAGHLIMGAVTGSGMGMFAVRKRKCLLTIPAGLFLGFLLHFLWDVVAFETADYVRDHGQPLWSQNVASMGVMVCGMVLFRVAAWRAGARLPS
ncbi:MAG: PrsW family glutamic-type intramembrane protease [Phycisphaerales bacterium]